MNTADIILLILIAAAVICAVISIVRQRRKGGCCGCESCPMHGSCGKHTKRELQR